MCFGGTHGAWVAEYNLKSILETASRAAPYVSIESRIDCMPRYPSRRVLRLCGRMAEALRGICPGDGEYG